MNVIATIALGLLHPHSVAPGSEGLFLVIGFSLGLIAGLAVRSVRGQASR